MTTQIMQRTNIQPAKADVSNTSAKSSKASAKASKSDKDSFGSLVDAATAKDAKEADALSENAASKGNDADKDTGLPAKGDAKDSSDAEGQNDAQQQLMAAANTPNVTNPAAQQEAETVSGGTAAVVLDLQTLQQTEPEQPSLQALLPQDKADGQKSQDFLAMLSGQKITGGEDAAYPQVSGAPKSVATQNAVTSLLQQTEGASQMASTLQMAQDGQKTLTPLEASLAWHSAQDALQANPAGISAQNVVQLVQTVAVEEMPEATALNGLQQTAAAQKPEKTQDTASLLGDAALTVDSEPQDSLQMMLHQAARSGRGDAQPDAQQQNAALFQQEDAEQPAPVASEVPESPKNTQAPQQAPAQHTGASFAQTLTNTQSVQQAQAPQEALQARMDYDIPRQIVDQAHLIQRGEDTEMVIHLKPEHLDLTLKVSVTQNGSVNASFHSQNAEVRTILENSLVQLRQDLNNQGIKVDNVGVYAGLGNELPQSDGGAAYQNPQQHRGDRRNFANGEDYEEGLESIAGIASAAQQEGLTAGGVDYRI